VNRGRRHCPVADDRILDSGVDAAVSGRDADAAATGGEHRA